MAAVQRVAFRRDAKGSALRQQRRKSRVSAMGGKGDLRAATPSFGSGKIFMEIYVLLATALLASASPAPRADCLAAWTDAAGEPQSTWVVLDLASPSELDPAALPERTSGIACPRASIVPLPEDIRVLGELGVSLGIIEEGGRTLWIWSQNGLLQTTVDDGELSAAEAADVNRWSAAAQTRFERRRPRR